MRIALLLLFGIILNVGANNVYSQNAVLTLNLKNVTVEDALLSIEENSNYHFLYNSKLIDVDRKVNIDAKGQSITAILQSLFKNTDVVYRVEGEQIILSKKSLNNLDSNQAPTKERVIRGVVSDKNDEPIIGASVAVKGTTIGGMTDLDGRFELKVPEGSVVTISFLGFLPYEFKLDDKSDYKIILEEDNKLLEEVVVVGYGTQKKVNLTGAVAQVSSDDLKDRPVANIGQALQGMIPNFNVTFSSGKPGAGASYNIRGNTSPNGGSPLILVDGIETNPDRINSNDIESISVLKDAASAAIYGARGAFGVILITTKSGSKDQKPTISYSGYFSVSAPTTSTDFETRGYYSAKIADTFMMGQNGTSYTKYTDADYQALWDRRNDKTENSARPWVLTENRNGVNSYIYLANFDWYNYLYDDRKPTHDHNINISGGDKRLSYMISGRFYRQEGVQRLNQDDYTSYNMRSKLSLVLKPWLTISNNTKYFAGIETFSGYDSEYNNWRKPTLHALASFVPVNPDGTAVSHTSLTNSSSHYIMDGYNAMMQKGLSGGKKRTQEFTTKFDLDFTITNDLSAKGSFGYTKGYLRNDYRSVKVQYSQYPGVIENEPEGNFPDSYQDVVWDQEYFVADAYANYKKAFGDHNLEVIGGYNYEAKYYRDLKVTRKGLLTEELTDFNLATGEIPELTGGRSEYAIMGLFYRAAYNYKGKYLFEANGRYDGSSRFPRGDRFGFFPSFSAAYRVSEESFFSPLRTWIDNLKIRASYGSLGNQQIGYYDFVQNINTKGTMDNYTFDRLTNPGYASVDNPVAASMTWEKVVMQNIGLDMNFLNSRLNVNLDAYIRDTKGILRPGKTLPAIYGASSPKVNANDIRTKGFELVLNWQDKVTLMGKPFSYSITGSLADYTAKYTKVDNPSNKIGDPYIGQSVGEIWGYRIGGLFATDEEALEYTKLVNMDNVAKDYVSGTSSYGDKARAGDMKYLDLNGDGVINGGNGTLGDTGDRVIIGNAQPRYSYGFNLSFNWNGIDASAFFQGIGRQHWYPGNDNLRFWGPYSRSYATFVPRNFMADVWSEDNPDAYYPRPRGSASLSSGYSLYYTNDRYLQDLAYCRLKNLTVGYTIPASIVSKVGLTNCRIYFSGENLVTWTKLKNKFLDPEQASAADDKKANVYPWSKTFSFGLNLTF